MSVKPEDPDSMKSTDGMFAALLQESSRRIELIAAASLSLAMVGLIVVVSTLADRLPAR